ncbi:MAG TPA: sugar ABC transporter permease [Clostridia bacterium]|nr:sugar ABC transporter permease [Clostridia bacterium]
MAQRSDTVGPAAPEAGAAGQVGRRFGGSSPASRRLREQLIGWSFALPFLLIFVIFMAGPIAASMVLSLTDFGLRDLRNPLGTDFIGLDNYTTLLSDPKFQSALFNTAYFVIVGVPLTLGLGLGAALALDRGIRHFKTLFRVGYYLPVVTSIVAIAVVWRFLLNPDQGLLNMILDTIGINGPNWLADPTLAMPSIIAMAAWRNLGFAMIVFLAGLQTIPAQLYEAASIDGAGRWQAFRHVTLPLLRPTILFLVVITTIGYLQLFEEPFVMTDGGPLDKTLSISMYMYQQGFEFFNQGYAAAIAWILFVLVAIVAVVQFRLLRSEG